METIIVDYDNGRDRLQFAMSVDENATKEEILERIKIQMKKYGWKGSIVSYESLDDFCEEDC